MTLPKLQSLMIIIKEVVASCLAFALFTILLSIKLKTKANQYDKKVTHVSNGASGRNRTGTPVKARDFKSLASTNSATKAKDGYDFKCGGE